METERELELFAGVAVTDLGRAAGWYHRLFGEVETFDPNDTERVWTVAERRHVYVEQRPEHAGHSFVTLFVGDLDEAADAAARRGIHPESRETYGNGVRKVIYRDPDGNEIGLGGAPSAQ
ncbi:VOC family protein [Occultella glacieicola]|uniref:VOC family protein n=1 Tax=Occultella glacieicola TaxID=2518684 RepID=A0ABY2E799_9MICO|nr:VOC family protein [Occultella glacieicola]TDE92747.1 VOC family protein [Occultella glacieicola]